jgi:hypothetical protein
LIKLVPTNPAEISALVVSYALSDHKRFSKPEVLCIRYSGVYRIGADGAGDATFIVATAECAHRLWYSAGIILDFTELSYRCGDEMEWVLGIGRSPHIACDYPLVILTGADCTRSLQSLFQEEYSAYCRDSFETALELMREKVVRYNDCLDTRRRKWIEESRAAKARPN